MRARMAIAAAGLDPEHREVDLSDRPAHLRSISPKATVPVVQLANGTVIDESLDVMRWALGQNDQEGWLPRDGDVAQTDTLIATNDWDFKTDLAGGHDHPQIAWPVETPRFAVGVGDRVGGGGQH